MKSLVHNITRIHSHTEKYIPFLICFLFFIAYTVLSVIRHTHYGSFGFDLGIYDQVVWKYSRFHTPITTIQHFPYTSLLTDHFELILPLISWLYWIAPTPHTLLILQSFLITFSAIPVYLLCKKRNLHPVISYALMISYLSFFGIQNAIWFDFHTLSIAAGILPWFVYFLDRKQTIWASVSFILAIICKEDIALLTFLISSVFFVIKRERFYLYLLIASLAYLFFVFFVYFPYLTKDGYRYAGNNGLLSNINPFYMVDTPVKQQTILYSLAHFGLLPLLAPLYLIPALGDLAHYFVLGRNISAAQEFFMHYRVALSFLLVWPTIIAIHHFRKKLNHFGVGIYIVVCALFFQYHLHLPLSYLAKSWFWTTPSSVLSINQLSDSIPENASVVSQNNITPHIAHRDEIFTLWPDNKVFRENSPCGQDVCKWFRWAGNPQFLIVNKTNDWDIRHTLYNHEEYIEALSNLEKSGYVKQEKQIEESILYKVIKHPKD